MYLVYIKLGRRRSELWVGAKPIYGLERNHTLCRSETILLVGAAAYFGLDSNHSYGPELYLTLIWSRTIFAEPNLGFLCKQTLGWSEIKPSGEAKPNLRSEFVEQSCVSSRRQPCENTSSGGEKSNFHRNLAIWSKYSMYVHI